MSTGPVERVALDAQPTAVVRGRVAVHELPEFLGVAFHGAMAAMSEQGLAPTGPPFARYRPDGDAFDVVAGFPTTGVIVPAGRVQPDELPGGPAAQVLYRGAYGGLGEAYAAAERWLSEQGYAPTGEPWESYLDGPDVAEPRTLVHQPYGPA